MFNLSEILVFFAKAKSIFVNPGPYTLLRPIFPNVRLPAAQVGVAVVLVVVKVQGTDNTPGFDIHCPNGLPLVWTGPLALSVIVLPIPLKLDESNATRLIGFPVCQLTTGASSQPLTKRLPLKG